MANTYFDFKEFRIEQSSCANKVSTDACVFGAWMARLIEGGNVLDIGCGSGLLSLMIAQGKAHYVTGIELEENCAQQAVDNVSQSPFANKVEIINTDARAWTSNKEFDWIISNPPFFNNTYQNSNSHKTQARQTATLGAKDWEQILKRHCGEQTQVAFILSNNDVLVEYQQVLQDIGLHLRRIQLLDRPNASCKRLILFASKQAPKVIIPSSFTYKDLNGDYTQGFVELLKEYYFYL